MFPKEQDFIHCLLRKHISLPWHFRFHKIRIQVLLNTTPWQTQLHFSFGQRKEKQSTLSVRIASSSWQVMKSGPKYQLQKAEGKTKRMASLAPALSRFHLRSTFCVAMLCCHLYDHSQAWQNTDVFLQSWELLVPGLWHWTTTTELYCTEALVLHILPHPTWSAFIMRIPSVQKCNTAL